jgi:hypothetical protein
VSGKNILIGIPAYDSKVYANTMVSIFNNIKEVERLGHTITFTLQMKGAYLDLNRNKIVNDFLKGEFTDLIFIDSDVAFEYDAIPKLLARDVMVVGGVYPYREMEDKGYPVDIKLDENKFPVTDFNLGLIECLHIPTGFMRIRRDAFTILNEKYPDNKNDKGEAFHFRTGIVFAERGDRQYYGEDVYFCKICNEAGIKIYCDPTIEFIHFGTLPKKGRFSEFLKNGGKDK